MPRRNPMRGDPSLARAHDAGAPVICVQMLEHEELGAVGYEWPRFWPVFLSEARGARDELGRVHDTMARADPRPSDSRLLRYEDVEPAVTAHARMTIAMLLTLRYFVLEIERVAGVAVREDPADDLDRFRSSCIEAGLEDPGLARGWSLLGELAANRHRVEHPTQETIYSAEAWDHVPLAWSLTKRALDAFDAFDELFCTVADAWETRKGDFSKPGTLTIGERGLRGRRSAKRPLGE